MTWMKKVTQPKPGMFLKLGTAKMKDMIWVVVIVDWFTPYSSE